MNYVKRFDAYHMMNVQAIEGIIIKTVVFEEKTQFVTLFSKEEGVITIAVKHASSKYLRSYSPLLKAEAQVEVSKKDIWKCKEFAVVTSYPAIRKSLQALQGASIISSILLKGLPPYLPIHDMWHLFDEILMTWGRFQNPIAPACIFLCKFLYQEALEAPSIKSLLPLEQHQFYQFASQPYTQLYTTSVEKSFFKKVIHISEEILRISLFQEQEVNLFL